MRECDEREPLALGRRGRRGGLDRASTESRLRDIEERRKEAKAAVKARAAAGGK